MSILRSFTWQLVNGSGTYPSQRGHASGGIYAGMLLLLGISMGNGRVHTKCTWSSNPLHEKGLSVSHKKLKVHSYVTLKPMQLSCHRFGLNVCEHWYGCGWHVAQWHCHVRYCTVTLVFMLATAVIYAFTKKNLGFGLMIWNHKLELFILNEVNVEVNVNLYPYDFSISNTHFNENISLHFVKKML